MLFCPGRKNSSTTGRRSLAPAPDHRSIHPSTTECRPPSTPPPPQWQHPTRVLPTTLARQPPPTRGGSPARESTERAPSLAWGNALMTAHTAPSQGLTCATSWRQGRTGPHPTRVGPRPIPVMSPTRGRHSSTPSSSSSSSSSSLHLRRSRRPCCLGRACRRRDSHTPGLPSRLVLPSTRRSQTIFAAASATAPRPSPLDPPRAGSRLAKSCPACRRARRRSSSSFSSSSLHRRRSRSSSSNRSCTRRTAASVPSVRRPRCSPRPPYRPPVPGAWCLFAAGCCGVCRCGHCRCGQARVGG